MSRSTELTPTMQKAVEFMRQHGGMIQRYQGGYWNKPGCQNYFEYYRIDLGGGMSEPAFGTTTIEGLVKRGAAVWTEWKEKTDSYRFPIAAKLKETTDAAA